MLRFTSIDSVLSSMFLPKTEMVPSVGLIRPVSILMVVDLPAPLGPKKP